MSNSPEKQLNSNKSHNSYAMWMHLSATLGVIAFMVLDLHYPLTSVIAPFVLWQLYKSKGSFVDQQGREAFRFQLVIEVIFWIFFGICLIVPFLLLIFIPLSFVFIFLQIFYPSLAAARANDGQPHAYRFIFSPRLTAWKEFKESQEK